MNEDKDFLGNIIGKISQGGGWLVAIVTLVLVFAVTYHVSGRYLFGSPTHWMIVVVPLGFVFAVYFGLGFAEKEDVHSQIGLVVDRFSAKWQSIISIITLVLSLLFVAALVWSSLLLVQTSYISGRVMVGMIQVPLWIPNLFVPIGCALLFLQLLVTLKKEFSSLSTSKGKRGG